MKVGIFDSGMGGLSVLYEAMKQLPNADYIYYGDSKNAPYGIKTKEEVIDLSVAICQQFIEDNVDVIVVACNTATSAAIAVLREYYAIPIIGIEPALKPAVEHNSGEGIAVMATPMTLKEKKFNALMDHVAAEHQVYKVPAPKIVELVESNKIDTDELYKVIEDYFMSIRHSIESVVLGCTHFIFVKEHIQKILGSKIQLFDGNSGTVKQLIHKVGNRCESSTGKVVIYNSAGQEKVDLSYELLGWLKAHDRN